MTFAADRPEAPAVAFAVTSHGFGHAARVCAVIEALWARQPGVRPVIFSAAPATFFTDNLGSRARVETVEVDIGLAQRDALTVDVPASLRRLEAFASERRGRLTDLARRVRASGAEVLVADIAPLGLAAAARLGLPSVLIESFTWDTIYRGYQPAAPAFGVLADRAARDAASATLRCQCAPCCQPLPDARAVAPIARTERHGRAATRRALDIPAEAPVALVTMGGIPWHHPRPDGEHRAAGDAWLVVASDVPAIERHGRQITLPHRSPFFHPDLVSAADVVVAKLGYSTVAEVASVANRPTAPILAYVPRPDFPESPVLEAWVRTHLDTVRIAPETFRAGGWRQAVGRALAGQVERRSRPAPATSGADQVARYLLELLRAPRSASARAPGAK